MEIAHAIVATEQSSPAFSNAEMLEDGVPTPPELSVRLEQIAMQVQKRGDAITLREYMEQIRTAVTLTSLGSAMGAMSISTLANALDKFPEPVADLGFATGVVAMGASALEGLRVGHKASKKGGVQIEGGYGIQCLRAEQATLSFERDEIVAALHPPFCPEGKQEPQVLAARRLSETLEVVECAPSISKALIPASALSTAGIYLPAKRSYARTIKDILPSGTRAHIPYDSSERVVMLSREGIIELRDLLRTTDGDHLLRRVLVETAERFYTVQDRLQPTTNPDTLQSTLRTILHRAVDAELPSSQRWRYHDSYGNYTDTRARLTTTIDFKTDNGNPRVIQRRPDYQEVDAYRLASLTGTDEELLADIAGKLDRNEYSDTQLVAVALKVLERKLRSETETTHTENHEEVNASLGSNRSFIRYDNETPRKRQHVRRFLGKVAAVSVMGGALLTGSTQLTANLADNIIGSPGTATAEDPYTSGLGGSGNPDLSEFQEGDYLLWRLDAHDISTEGYWPQATFYHLAPGERYGGWLQGEDLQPSRLVFPETLDNLANETPYITVSGFTDFTANLPVKDGTTIGAVRIEPLTDVPTDSITLTIDRDGQITLNNPEWVPISIEYDLILDNAIHTEHPITAEQPLDIETSSINPAVFPLAFAGPQAQAGYTANNFVYDNSRFMSEIVVEHRDDPQQIAPAVYGAERCNCNMCATSIAVVQAAANPRQYLAYTTGYANTGSRYLQPARHHAWLTNEQGEIIDGTPGQLDATSNVYLAMDDQTLDEVWESRPMPRSAESAPNGPEDKTRLPIFALLGLAAAGALILDRRYRVSEWALATARFVGARSRLSPEYALQLLAREAYGRSNSSLPQPGQTPVIFRNIPEDVLRRAAKGRTKLHGQLNRGQRRALRRTSQALYTAKDITRRQAPQSRLKRTGRRKT